MTPGNDPKLKRMMSELFDDLVIMHGRKAVRAAFDCIDDDGEPDDVDETDWAQRFGWVVFMTTHPNHTTTISPAELYTVRRSTEASQATARSALNAAARALGYDGFEQMDWAIGYSEAALIRAGVNRLEPGWAKVVLTAVRQTTVIARSLRLIEAETASDILDIAAPRGARASGTTARLQPQLRKHMDAGDPCRRQSTPK